MMGQRGKCKTTPGYLKAQSESKSNHTNRYVYSDILNGVLSNVLG